MSHLFKNENKKYFFIFKIVFCFLIIFLTYCGFNSYEGNKIIYLLFSIISNYLIYFSFRKNSIFFETFLGLLLWLGFWFKFTCIIAFTDGIFREGVGLFNYTPESFNETLVVSQIGILSFILAGYFREIFVFKYPSKLNFFFKVNNFFKKRRKQVWIIFSIFFILISFSNFYLKVYQKGLLPIYDLNFVFSSTYKWLLLFGLTSISAVIIFLEANAFRKFFVFSSLLIFFETFLSSLSMLSRGMIFNAFALLFGIYKYSKKTNTSNKLTYYLKSLSIILVLFYISVISVNYIRANYFYVGKSFEFASKDLKKKIGKETKTNYSNISQHNSEIYYLLINRWVGIDGVMAVISKKEILNKMFLFNSFKERAKKTQPTFYELKFNLDTLDYSKQIYLNVKGNTLPGIIAFLFYSGSYYFLFISIFTICIIASLIEYLAFRLSYNNLIFSALIGQVISFRLIHFGYLPHQSYLLFGSIIITIFLVYLTNFYIKEDKLKIK